MSSELRVAGHAGLEEKRETSERQPLLQKNRGSRSSPAKREVSRDAGRTLDDAQRKNSAGTSVRTPFVVVGSQSCDCAIFDRV
jgi:hypothetical protein